MVLNMYFLGQVFKLDSMTKSVLFSATISSDMDVLHSELILVRELFSLTKYIELYCVHSLVFTEYSCQESEVVCNNVTLLLCFEKSNRVERLEFELEKILVAKTIEKPIGLLTINLYDFIHFFLLNIGFHYDLSRVGDDFYTKTVALFK